jgi:asparagine synthase (glutamine-hydrolysing)
MSAIAAWFGAAAEPVVHTMLDVGRPPGERQRKVVGRGAAALGVDRMQWETDPAIAGAACVAVDGPVAVVADATLYHRAGLEQSLAATGVRARGSDAAHLIAAAYRAWGEQCARHLEGDFAFVVHDAEQRRVVAARDFGGRRPLHFARIGGGLALGTTVAAVLAHPECGRELNLVSVAEAAAGLTGSATETSYREVSRLPAAHTLVWDGISSPMLLRHWTPRTSCSGEGASTEESARHLLHLMQEAMRERMPPAGRTAIFLSGGWDSPALFAAGRSLPDGGGDGDRLRPVSISYPPGDPGREDEIIEAILERWQTSTRWIPSDQIPFWPDAAERAARREEPFAHAFEDWNGALFDGAREEGARIALDGYGGDQLFQVSPVFFADLLRSGAVRELLREWQHKGLSRRDRSAWLQWVVLPLLPEVFRDAARKRGRADLLRSHLERTIPGWLAPEFVRRHALVEREREHNPVRWHGERSTAEMRWYLENPFFPGIVGYLGRLGEACGVEVRSPLFDRRVVEFALRRPRWERSSERETKRLLRAAVEGLLPAWVLGPRRWRTGTTDGYLTRALTGDFATLMERVLARPLLAELGIADAAALRGRLDHFSRSSGTDVGMELFHATQAELWLRARVGGEHLATEKAVMAAL